MNKREKIIFVRIIPIFFMLIFCIIPVISCYAEYNIVSDLPSPSSDTTGIAGEAKSIMDNVTGATLAVAKGLAATMLIYMGIKYVTSAPEGRAEYRKMMIPYVVGVVIIYSYDTIINQIVARDYEGIIKPHTDAVGNALMSISKVICIIMLLIIGIKYVMSAPEGRAEYRKTMIPYVVGVILIYSVSFIGEGGSTIITNIRNAEYNSIVSNQVDAVENAVRYAGEAIALIMLIVLGIKYMTSAPEGKAEYRKTMIPYLVGAVIIFAASRIRNIISNQAQFGGDYYTDPTRNVLTIVLNVLRYAGVGMAIIMLIVLAIKYMSTAPEGKAEVQKTMVPYIIGAVVLFAAGTFVGIIQTFAEGI